MTRTKFFVSSTQGNNKKFLFVWGLIQLKTYIGDELKKTSSDRKLSFFRGVRTSDSFTFLLFSELVGFLSSLVWLRTPEEESRLPTPLPPTGFLTERRYHSQQDPRNLPWSDEHRRQRS